MAIQPISRTDYVSHVSFGEKHKKGCKPDGGQHMTPAAKAIPVVVLMAMSPLNQSAAAADYNKQMASYPTTEVVVQSPQEPQKKGLPQGAVKTLNGEYFRVWGVHVMIILRMQKHIYSNIVRTWEVIRLPY